MSSPESVVPERGSSVFKGRAQAQIILKVLNARMEEQCNVVNGELGYDTWDDGWTQPVLWVGDKIAADLSITGLSHSS